MDLRCGAEIFSMHALTLSILALATTHTRVPPCTYTRTYARTHTLAYKSIFLPTEYKHRQTNSQSQTNKLTITDKQTHNHRQTNSQTQTNKLTNTDKQTHKHRQTNSQTQTNKLTYTNKQTHKHRQTN